jgi:hypothetical protein
MAKAVLFDADGVLTVPEDMFSNIYARSHGFDPAELEPFLTVNSGRLLSVRLT